ncbi:putative lipoprotein [Vibrio crassostreae]|nr:putative lipoprotein [Vibrio crassostreae]CAK2987477.1 putative lipoprotein [Vibrio crassostreae]CAK2988639.1 putative lipoprotein [Vibrio crassostreae]CAK3002479.1 putative lipoprotein [Vibrio crassostreae]CAK3004680.1 putative lipoprotein [Vibrio crassostreae]
MKIKTIATSIALMCLASNVLAQPSEDLPSESTSQELVDQSLPSQTTDQKSSVSQTQSAKQPQDMSDPLAVYTQAGFGVTNKGLNLKVGQSYDTGSDTLMGMNVIEVKGVAGELLGWSGSDSRDNSIDSLRFRNFTVNTTNGRGKQIDLNYNVEREQLDASYSFIQALPKWGAIQLYPLAGVGARIMNGQFTKTIDTESGEYDIDKSIGYTIPGVYGVVGMYSKITITDKIWINYNPMWLTSIAGSDGFVDQGFGGDSDIFTNELSIGYQFTPRFNTRYYANWTQDQAYFEGDQRLEFNYQF